MAEQTGAGNGTTIPVVLAIGGLDPTGHAGLAADLRAGNYLGVLVAPVATALTVQDQGGVKRIQAVDPDLVGEQISAALRSHRVGAVKIGMLPGPDQMAAVVRALTGFTGPRILDPVQSATPGGSLTLDGWATALIGRMAPSTTLITPNLAEAASLLGQGPITDADQMVAAARGVKDLGFPSVLLKGGHLPGKRSPEYLVEGDTGIWLEGPRLDTPHTRGSGCFLATLIACLMAMGQPVRMASIGAKNNLTMRIRRGSTNAWPLGPGPFL